jgi:hypothetical protein
MTYKQDHEPDNDLELQKLLTISDEELLKEARDEGIDVPAVVRAMRKRIADKLRAAQPVQAAGHFAVRGMAAKESTWEPREEPRRRVPLDPDIAGLELETISYLAVLQHRWSDGKVSVVEQEYRGWLQLIRNLGRMGAAITPSADCHRYWECHIQHATQYLAQTTALFGTPLLHWPDRTAGGGPQLDDGRQRLAGSAIEVAEQLRDQAASIETTADWKAGTVHVDDGNRHLGSPRPATRSCAHCTAHALERVLGNHVTPLPGVALARRIVVHHVEMDECGECGDSRLTLDGRIKAERCTHRAILFLRKQAAQGAGPAAVQP